MKRLVLLAVLTAILLALPVFGISDTSASIANNSITDTETGSVPTEDECSSSNSSATATITIAMTTATQE